MTSTRLIPAVALVYIVIAISFTRQLHCQRKSLVEQRRIASETVTATDAHPASLAELEARLQSLTKSLSSEVAATEAAIFRARELAQKTSIDPHDVTTSFGKIEQMAAPFGEALLALYSSAIAKPGQTSLDDRAIGVVAARMMALAPILREMEDQPSEIAHFETAILRDMFSLDADRSAKVEGLLQQDFATLKEAGYTASQKPDGADAENAWFAKRDKTISQFVEELKPLLPDADKLPLAPVVLNIGAGLRIQTTISPDGHGSVSAGIPGITWAK
jgi:hypothetical protein